MPGLEAEGETMKRFVSGEWPPDDLRRVFVAGAQFWQHHAYHSTMFPSESDIVAEEAERRFPNGESPLYEKVEDGWMVEVKPLTPARE